MARLYIFCVFCALTSLNLRFLREKNTPYRFTVTFPSNSPVLTLTKHFLQYKKAWNAFLFDYLKILSTCLVVEPTV